MSPGEAPPLDERRIFEVFARHGVEYVLVGGLGARLHGATRFTSDFDACPGWDRENLARLAAALNELGARLRDFPPELPFPPLTAERLRRQLVGTWRTDAGDLDILIGIPSGVANQEHQYEALRSRATPRDIAGCTVYVADLGDIIASKEAADRDKDREALPELRALQAARLARRRIRRGSKPPWARRKSRPLPSSGRTVAPATVVSRPAGLWRSDPRPRRRRPARALAARRDGGRTRGPSAPSWASFETAAATLIPILARATERSQGC